MSYFRQLYRRVVAWWSGRTQDGRPDPVPDFVLSAPSVGRDVSARGVRFFSLCGSCGSRLETSATLCEECASHRTGSREPWR